MNDEQQTITYPADYLRNFTTEVFMYFGVPKTDAEQASDVLAKSDLRGIDSHGIARLRAACCLYEMSLTHSAASIFLPWTAKLRFLRTIPEFSNKVASIDVYKIIRLKKAQVHNRVRFEGAMRSGSARCSRFERLLAAKGEDSRQSPEGASPLTQARDVAR